MEVLGVNEAFQGLSLGPIPHPDPAESVAELLEKSSSQQTPACAGSHSEHGDGVVSFDEVAAAQGALGRFPGREVMPLVKSFLSSVH